MGNATRMGIMGAILGGLKFKLDEDTQRRAEEAELRKMQRLEQLYMAREGRENAEWGRRTEIDDRLMRERESEQTGNQLLVQNAEQEFRAGQSEADRGHDEDMVDLRSSANMREIERQAELQRQNAQFDEKLRRTRPPEPGDPKGIQGDDGQFYPAGTPIPDGVRPVAGYGTTWAPSDSKTDAPGARRSARGQPAGRGESASIPAGYVMVGTKGGKSVYRAPDGTLHIED